MPLYAAFASLKDSICRSPNSRLWFSPTSNVLDCISRPAAKTTPLMRLRTPSKEHASPLARCPLCCNFVHLSARRAYLSCAPSLLLIKKMAEKSDIWPQVSIIIISYLNHGSAFVHLWSWFEFKFRLKLEFND